MFYNLLKTILFLPNRTNIAICTNNSILETKNEWVAVRFSSRGEVLSLGLAGSLSGDIITIVGYMFNYIV